MQKNFRIFYILNNKRYNMLLSAINENDAELSFHNIIKGAYITRIEELKDNLFK